MLQNSGQIAPLDEIIRLKEKYRFRVLLDESNSFGVLGSSGRGLTEHCGVAVCTLKIFRVLTYLWIFYMFHCGCGIVDRENRYCNCCNGTRVGLRGWILHWKCPSHWSSGMENLMELPFYKGLSWDPYFKCKLDLPCPPTPRFIIVRLCP